MRKEAEDRKQEIIEEFYRVIIEDGLEKASLVNIARRLSVSPSLLIHHFKNKDELILSLIDFIIKRYIGAFLKIIQDIHDKKERILAIIDVVLSEEWSKTIDDRAYITCLYLSHQNKRVRERLRVMHRMFINMLEEEIAGLVDADSDGDIQAEKVTRLIICVQEGLDIYKDLFPEDRHFNDLGNI